MVYRASYGSALGSDVDKTRGLNIDDHILFPNEKATDLKGPNRLPQSIHSHEELDKLDGPDKEFHFKDAHAHNGECLALYR